MTYEDGVRVTDDGTWHTMEFYHPFDKLINYRLCDIRVRQGQEVGCFDKAINYNQDCVFTL